MLLSASLRQPSAASSARTILVERRRRARKRMPSCCSWVLVHAVGMAQQPLLCQAPLVCKRQAAPAGELPASAVRRRRCGRSSRTTGTASKRLGRYGLRLHPDKTRCLDFRPNRPRGRGQGAAFDFLGFTHYWVRSRKGYPVVRQTTAKSRFARATRAVYDWCRRHRHDAVHKQREYLASVLRGHGNYYGLRGNSVRLSSFHYQVARMWWKWLSRRSRKSRLNWDKMRELLRRLSAAGLASGPPQPLRFSLERTCHVKNRVR